VPRRAEPAGRRAAARRIALTALAGALVATGALAISILAFGELGATQRDILATTFLLAAFTVLALPGAILVDRRRLLPLAVAGVALAGAAFALAATAVWVGDPPEALGKAIGTVVGAAVAVSQTAALAAWRRDADAPGRLLFVASTVVAAVLAAGLTVVIWAELDTDAALRAFGAAVVLDVLLVALQPVTALRRGGARRPAAGGAPSDRFAELVRSVGDAATVIAHELADARTELDVIEALLDDARARVAEQRVTLDELRAGLAAASSSSTEGGAMTVPALARLLTEAEVAYEVLPHDRTMRAADEAAALHLPAGEVAKTVVLLTPDKRVRVVIPASERLDLDKARVALGNGAAVRLASEQRLSIDYPMFELGAVPPLGGPPGDRILVDRRVAARASVVFESGAHDESIRIGTADLLRVTRADVVDVCRAAGAEVA
jgi:Ala-tRNA(Pro) deacylase